MKEEEVNPNELYTEKVKHIVWRKAKSIAGIASSERRQDQCGAWIDWDQYGETYSGGSGWVIDHIVPIEYGGTRTTSNLQPLQWENALRKANQYPDPDFCIVSGSKISKKEYLEEKQGRRKITRIN
ncbi:HNH endonuclease [Flavobacteriales bacterium]|nr:HNH endonuclease [Flavobacteriales bacterium]